MKQTDRLTAKYHVNGLRMHMLGHPIGGDLRMSYNRDAMEKD